MTLCASPMPAKVDNSDVPPELMKGSVNPVTGINVRFMPIETIVWKKMKVATP